MNCLHRIRTIKYSRLIRTYSSEKSVSPWLYHNKTRPYPKTEEEKVAASNRYGLFREEYEPHPEGSGYGDYPEIKDESPDERDAYYPWTDNYFRRLEGEPFHPFAYLYTCEKISTKKVNYSLSFMMTCFFLGCSVFVIALTVFEDFRREHKLLIKQFPQPGVIHYTFDLIDEDDLQNLEAESGAC